jgi:DNA-binding XRE family transcriptional regulator
VRGQSLRGERQAAELTQKVVAELAGLAREHLVNIEAGRREFSAEMETCIREAIRQAASSGVECRKPGRPRRPH